MDQGFRDSDKYSRYSSPLHSHPWGSARVTGMAEMRQFSPMVSPNDQLGPPHRMAASEVVRFLTQ